MAETEPIGPFLGLDVADAVELGELLTFLSDWLASDPNRLDASLHDYVAPPDHIAAACRIDELRAHIERYAQTLLGYDTAGRIIG